MTATTEERPTVLDTGEMTRVPLSRLVRVELRKTMDTRAGKWLLITIGILSAGLTVVLFFAGSKADLTFDNFVGIALFPVSTLLPVLGILAITSEWSQRTGLVTFTLEPSRARVVGAKVVALLVMALSAVALAFALGALGNVLGEIFRDGSGSWHYTAAWLGEVTLYEILVVLQGFAFGMLFMSSALAIVIYFVLPTAWTILFNAVSALQSAAPWVDFGTAGQRLSEHDVDLTQWAQVGVTTGLWIGLVMLVGAVRLLRSEVK